MQRGHARARLHKAAFMAAMVIALTACGAPETEAPPACLEIAAPDPDAPQAGMVWIAQGEVVLGSQDFYPEERPVRTAAVEGFWISPHAVTNGEFAAFVAATGYVTLAERAGPHTYGRRRGVRTGRLGARLVGYPRLVAL